jgi:hypothetical protein
MISTPKGNALDESADTHFSSLPTCDGQDEERLSAPVAADACRGPFLV